MVFLFCCSAVVEQRPLGIDKCHSQRCFSSREQNTCVVAPSKRASLLLLLSARPFLHSAQTGFKAKHFKLLQDAPGSIRECHLPVSRISPCRLLSQHLCRSVRTGKACGESPNAVMPCRGGVCQEPQLCGCLSARLKARSILRRDAQVPFCHRGPSALPYSRFKFYSFAQASEIAAGYLTSKRGSAVACSEAESC